MDPKQKQWSASILTKKECCSIMCVSAPAGTWTYSRFRRGSIPSRKTILELRNYNIIYRVVLSIFNLTNLLILYWTHAEI